MQLHKDLMCQRLHYLALKRTFSSELGATEEKMFISTPGGFSKALHTGDWVRHCTIQL